MIRHLWFFITEACISLKRSFFMMFIAIMTISVSLIVFGLFLLITLNLNNFAGFITSKLEIRLFLDDTATSQEKSQFEQELLSYENVKDVIYVEKEKALSDLKKQYQHIDIESYIDDNPLPDTFRIVLTDNSKIASTAKLLRFKKPFISDVVYGGDVAERMEMFSTFVKLAGLTLNGLFILATLFIIVNTIRLTVINRTDEITIMQLVGATDQFIRGPFIIEGVIIGAAGSFVSVVFLMISYKFFAMQLYESLPFLPIIFDQGILNTIYIVVIFTGLSLGILGAYLSISRVLKTTS